MTKKLVLMSALFLGAIILTGCGGGSDTNDEEPQQLELSETGQEIVDNVKASNTDAFENQDALIKNGGYVECTSNGKTVLVDEGTTCKHSVTGAILSCKDNKVTLSGMTASEINILGYKYICQ